VSSVRVYGFQTEKKSPSLVHGNGDPTCAHRPFVERGFAQQVERVNVDRSENSGDFRVNIPLSPVLVDPIIPLGASRNHGA